MAIWSHESWSVLWQLISWELISWEERSLVFKHWPTTLVLLLEFLRLLNLDTTLLKSISLQCTIASFSGHMQHLSSRTYLICTLCMLSHQNTEEMGFLTFIKQILWYAAPVWAINEPYMPKNKIRRKNGLSLDVVMRSHPLRRMPFSQHQASSAALDWPGDGDCYLMHRIRSSGWPYPKGP